MLRRLTRHLALDALSLADALTGATSRRLRQPRIHFLYLHDLGRASEARLEELVGALRKTHRLVSYSQAVSALSNAEVTEPLLTISFDDGLEECARAGRTLKALGVSACFFLCGDVLEDRRPSALDRFSRDRLHSAPRAFLSWQDSERLLSSDHEVGSHTLGHRDLSACSAEEIHHEIGGSYELFTRRLGRVQHFAWPYGTFRHFSADARDAVFASGYVSSASAVRGSHRPVGGRSLADVCIRRDHVSLEWPLRHVLCLLGRSARPLTPALEGWPWPSRSDGSRLAASPTRFEGTT